MMKKTFALLVSLYLVLSISTLIAMPTVADDVGHEPPAIKTFEDYEYIVEEKNTVTVTRYLGSETSIEIPAVIEGIYVTAIGASAFANNTTLESVIIPKHVVTLRAEAFRNCSELNKVTFPADLTTIEEFAFRECISLETIHITENVETIGNGVFMGTPALTNITVAENNENYSSDNGILLFHPYSHTLILFQYPAGKTDTEYILPSTVDYIEEYAFYNAVFLESVIFPTSLREIYDNAFTGCVSLKSIYIPESVYNLGEAPFMGCRSLTQITVDKDNYNYLVADGILYLMDYDEKIIDLIKVPANISLYEFTIPDGIKRIGAGAFSECPSLGKVYIPESVESIGANAFTNTKLYSDFIASGTDMMYVGDHLVCTTSTAAEIQIKEGTKIIADRLFENSQTLEKLTISSSVTMIGYAAFQNCINLKCVNILDGVKCIDEYAFKNCSSLEIINLPKSLVNVAYMAFAETKYFNNENNWHDGVLYIDSILVRAKEDVTTCTIIDGTTLIAESAFGISEELKSLTIPEGVIVICENALGFSEKLRILTLPKSLKIIYENSIPGRVSEIVGYRKSKAEWLANKTSARFINIKKLPNKIKFLKKKVKIRKGEKLTLKLNFGKSIRARFSRSDANIIELSKRRRNKVTIEGLRKGNAVVSAKVAGKIANCTVKVLKQKKKRRNK